MTEVDTTQAQQTVATDAQATDRTVEVGAT